MSADTAQVASSEVDTGDLPVVQIIAPATAENDPLKKIMIRWNIVVKLKRMIPVMDVRVMVVDGYNGNHCFPFKGEFQAWELNVCHRSGSIDKTRLNDLEYVKQLCVCIPSTNEHMTNVVPFTDVEVGTSTGMTFMHICVGVGDQ